MPSPSLSVKFPALDAPARLPQRGNAFSRWACGVVLRLFGWRIEGEVAAVDKLVVLVGPHTSNWDFVLGMFILHHLGVRVNFMIKDSVFKFGFGRVLTWLGAIPVDRKSPKGVFQAAMRGFKHNTDGQLLVITPEGTRSNKTKLKEGFYLLAKRADAHLQCCPLDYENKRAFLYPAFEIGGRNFAQIEQVVDPFFEGVPGKNGYWMDREPDAKVLTPQADL